MNYFILKDIDITLLSLLYLEDVYNLTLVNNYFKQLCNDTLHDKIDDVNHLADKLIKNPYQIVKSVNNVSINTYQKLILLTRNNQLPYNLLKNGKNYTPDDIHISRTVNENNYHLSIFYDTHAHDDEDYDMITADFNIYGIRDFIRYALYNGFIIQSYYK